MFLFYANNLFFLKTKTANIAPIVYEYTKTLSPPTISNSGKIKIKTKP